MKYIFTTTEDQEAAITADAAGKLNADGEQLTNEEYVISQVVDRFLAEITNRGEKIMKEAYFDKYNKADPSAKAQVDALLEVANADSL